MSQLDFQQGLRILILLFMNLILSACTAMESRLSLEPYTKDKQKRNAVELLAESYCQQKRDYPGAAEVKKTPDFIFTTDGCSLVPDGDWAACCIVHDIPYWCGGSEADRADADQFLQQCVNKHADAVGDLYYIGVVIGGVPWLPTSWRWGYGWEDWPHGYETQEGLPSVMQLLENLNAEQVIQEHLNSVKQQ